MRPPSSADNKGMKSSVSMTSLPPNEQQTENYELTKAKLRIERPYNSLKKKLDKDKRDSLWRRSWGSGQSSCSLHSNATYSGTGKDELWTAIQTNYNYIMDTNLIDCCQEARGELESAAAVKMEVSQNMEKSHHEAPGIAVNIGDPRRLRQWLHEMEKRIALAPTMSATKLMESEDVMQHLTNYSDLFREIQSQISTVNNCIRALSTAGKQHSKRATPSNGAAATDQPQLSTGGSKEERPKSGDNNQATVAQRPQSSSAGSNVNRNKPESNLKGLESRFHMLYLRCIEIQCMLENQLGIRHRAPQSPTPPRLPSDTDEPVAKLARLSDSESEHNYHQFYSSPKRKQPFHKQCGGGNNLKANAVAVAAAAGFEADSEGSDYEVGTTTTHISTKSVANFLSVMPQFMLKMQSEEIMETEPDSNGNNLETSVMTTVSMPSPHQRQLQHKSPQTPAAKSVHKRSRQHDNSRFNRSNRKSKNCGTFYFRHLDTDGENQGISSQGSEAFNSADPSSEDDEWVFTNGNHPTQMEENPIDIAPHNGHHRGDHHHAMAGGDDVLDNGNTTSLMKPTATENASNANNINNNIVKLQPNNGIINNHSSMQSVQELKMRELSIGQVDNKFIAPMTPPPSHNAPLGLNDCKQLNKETIHQLVLGAETLVREKVLLKTGTTASTLTAVAASSTPIRSNRYLFAEAVLKSTSSSARKCDKMPHPKIKQVQDWLENQPLETSGTSPVISAANTDCEASGEYTESDSVSRDSDTSEGLADSVATCLQGDQSSRNTSKEVIGGSGDLLSQRSGEAGGVHSITKVTMRTKRRNSERPWSVSCISQLASGGKSNHSSEQIHNQGLANHSISESALNTLSLPPQISSERTSMRGADSKNSLKRRKMKLRKRLGGVRKSESASDGVNVLNKTLVKSESFSGHTNVVQILTDTLAELSLPKPRVAPTVVLTHGFESEEDAPLVMHQPNFIPGALTNSFPTASNLGSLAALANYHNEREEKDLSFTGTEGSNISVEQAWDNYQEKYNSENYSEGFDSDAARKLMEFGDDYRNCIDSQSDCCSSLSAANNFDSLSPPKGGKQMDLNKSEYYVDHSLRRRRTMELEMERRRKLSEGNRKLDDRRRSSGGADSTKQLSPKNKSSIGGSSRKLNFGTSQESLTSKHRKNDFNDNKKLSTMRSYDKSSFKVLSSSASSGNESDDEVEVKNLLTQSRARLENMDVLRIRHHLLRPEDYAEIITTCRDNVLCLESVLRGPTGTVLSSARCQDARELLSSWESLLGWSENASVARKLQEEMTLLTQALHKLGNHDSVMDSESTIQLAIEDLKNEKAQLHTLRSKMLRFNASVHSWLTRQDVHASKNANANAATTISDQCNNTKSIQSDCVQSDEILHAHLKSEVGDMYSAWDDADRRITNRLESLTTSLIAWKQFESGLIEFQEALGKDKGALRGLRGALDIGLEHDDLAHDVKEVAKRLSEKFETNVQMMSSTEEAVSNGVLNTALLLPFNNKPLSSGSLSDSGISDGGCGSDGGLSERERRLGALRRLAKQLENSLAPGSKALKSISQRMEAAECELRALQSTCRELIVRTAAKSSGSSVAEQEIDDVGFPPLSAPLVNNKGKQKKSPQGKRKNNKKRTTSSSVVLPNGNGPTSASNISNGSVPSSEPDPDDPKDDTELDKSGRKRWAWRVAKIALPVQLAILTLFCAACLLEPHCCDALNNLSMSFTPQLRYVRGPPPI